MIEIGLQVLVAVLLAVTIACAFVLNKRLGRLRDGREEMTRLIAELSVSSENAEKSIATLRRTALEDDEALGRRVADARTLRDEIGFLVDRAEMLSARLEEQIEAGRPAERRAVESFADAPETNGAQHEDAFYDGGAPVPEPDDDAELARTARATATAWLRGRSGGQPVEAPAGAVTARALR